MRSCLAVVVLAIVVGCGPPTKSTLPKPPVAIPADDLAVAKGGAKPVSAGDAKLVVKDPRVIDLDIIQIRVTQNSPGGEREATSVATADLFREANESAKAGNTKDAIARYRQLIADFPDSNYAPVSLFNIAALQDGQGDPAATIATLRELVGRYPNARESVEGHLYIAALQADKSLWADALATLDAALARTNFTFADRVEGNARKGYVLMELGRFDDGDAALQAAIADWRRAPRIDDPYYIAMATYYRGEIAHRRFEQAPIRLPDATLHADLEAKRVLAVKAYDHWKESLGFSHAYWGTAAGYQMSQIFVELWEAHVKAPFPTKLAVSARDKYVVEVHERVRPHLEKALEGHRMNLELAKAYGVDTTWSKGSAVRVGQVMELLAKDAKGNYVRPAN